ncbi:helix-turn-helix transcriptional regulator [Spiractinospora alimapuensis]|uniref:helix-turn-helix domain-containing protein n=1 Tax=Spiractinospora alimapuensis TaxID=2820884 RepID=UPI001F224F52|nr:helix-turn-helix transcriptional regulator [Spiractinospora alimapuensis]QVQ52678.1 helix-turn-helix transcriptional regulator [Spiractinospora alimapuensis]
MGDDKWTQWGAELRFHRTAAGLAQDKLAREMHLGASTISSFEGGTRRPSRDHAIAADNALATGGALVQKWDEVQDEREIPEDWRDYAKVERKSTEIREYQPTLLPGLLQTAEYAEVLLRSTGTWDSAQVERLAAARVARMEAIGSTALTFVVDEAVVRRIIGSYEIARRQLDAVLGQIEERRIKVLVIPELTPYHPGLFGSFRIMTLDDGRMIAHEEYRTGVNVVYGPKVNYFLALFDNLLAEALTVKASAEFISAVRKDL